MTTEQIEDQIQTLLVQAEPLRELDSDDPEQGRLTALVDEINRLRALQAKRAEREAMDALLESLTDSEADQ